MTPILESHAAQAARWPAKGKGILAHYDEDSIVVYQAYRPLIGRYAAEHGRFGDGFSFERMSWIKPNFLWMMYRSGWGTKEGQEVVLAIRMRRTGFDEILRQAVPSSWSPRLHATAREWQKAVEDSDVRLQWDPDHDPSGKPTIRRAVQLGLRGGVLRRYAEEWITEIEDISALVAAQREILNRDGMSRLMVPAERPYPVTDAESLRRIETEW